MLVRRPVRTSLGAAGVAICLGALLVAVASANRGRNDALDEIRRMGATVLTVSAEASTNRGGRARTGSVVTTLSLRDARTVEHTVPSVALVAGEVRSTIVVKVGALARQSTVAGVEPSYADLRASRIAAGRFFTAAEDAEGQRVAVLGASIARALFARVNPVGEQMRLRGIPFAVIGVLPARGAGLDAFDEDEVVFIPLTTARRRLFQVDYLDRLYVRVRPEADLDAAAAAIVAALDARHRPALGRRDFRVQDQRRLVTMRETTIRRLGQFRVTMSTALLGLLAGGIFALQLMSVRERRGEIGTRRAIGATRAMILSQFLIEAGIVALAGGSVGVALGVASARVTGAPLSRSFVAEAFAVSLAASLLAALGPARIAAHQAPAIALRAQ
jgi:putative ABC transport system permease protein